MTPSGDQLFLQAAPNTEYIWLDLEKFSNINYELKNIWKAIKIFSFGVKRKGKRQYIEKRKMKTKEGLW